MLYSLQLTFTYFSSDHLDIIIVIASLVSNTGTGTQKEINIVQHTVPGNYIRGDKLWPTGQIHLLFLKKATETKWPVKPTIFTIRPFQKGCDDLDLHNASQLTVHFQMLAVHGCQYTINENALLFFCFTVFSYIFSIIKIIFPHGKRKNIKEGINPPKYSQLLSSLCLEVGIKPRGRIGTVYHIIRPLL